jgi:hypothetical protein
MPRRHLVPFATFAAAALVVFALYRAGYLAEHTRPPGPRDLEEVGRIAQALGLHCRTDVRDGSYGCRLIVSEEPLSFERANQRQFGEIDHPSWRGTVAACVPPRAYRDYVHPEHGVHWGDVFLFGDPAVIRKLTTYTPTD